MNLNSVCNSEGSCIIRFITDVFSLFSSYQIFGKALSIESSLEEQ